MRTAAVLAAWLLAAVSPTHWSYHGKDGPRHWGELSHEFAQCSSGHQQSPIDIRDAPPAELPALQVHYGSVPLRAVNNGHTIQVDVPAGSGLTVGPESYDLKQFHFHAPSEEAVDGKRHALVMHLVHADAHGRLAVVALLFDVGSEGNSALASLFDNLPQRSGSEIVRDGESIRLGELLPSKPGYFEYAGSLTTPPCTEGVEWFVLQQPVTLSAEQLSAFRRVYADNARPLQPVGGRPVRRSAP